jgi:hypothetical protein
MMKHHSRMHHTDDAQTTAKLLQKHIAEVRVITPNHE